VAQVFKGPSEISMEISLDLEIADYLDRIAVRLRASS